VNVLIAFVNLEEAARSLGISRTSLYRLLRSGDLPSAKIGRSRRVRPIDVEALAARLVDGSGAAGRRPDGPSGRCESASNEFTDD